MKALILAAGEGSRLNSKRPKPLVELLGLSLIERVILASKKAGISDFVVVTGYLGDKLMNKLGNGERLGVNITYVHNEEWEKENGVSALKAKKYLDGEKFLLLMADHVFDYKILNSLKNKDGCFICVDKNLESIYDLDEATKVKIEGSIKDIGKNIKDYNAVDCGIFLFDSSFFDALEKCVREGKDRLKDAVKYMAERGEINYFDITGSFWIDIDTKEDLNFAKQKILSSLTKESDGFISRELNRKISKFLVKTEIEPKHVSV